MAFRKAKAEQAALKMSMYGPPGSGKTATSLLIAEGLAVHEKKRVAFVDTERGTDFYVVPNPQRKWHPEAFDIDVLYTKSLTEVLRDVKAINQQEYGVIVIDSISHLWDAAMAAYAGPKTNQGGIPMQAWSKIKQPYKDLLAHLINCPQHVLLLGRQTNEFEDDDGTMRTVGVKMRAEKETAHEPHVCIRMECVFDRGKGKKKIGLGIPTAFIEKDRTGMLQGQAIEWPDFDSIARPMLGLLGKTQGQIQSEEDAAQIDAEAFAREERERAAASRIMREQLEARLTLARTLKDVEAIGKEITPQAKKSMTSADVAGLRESYLAAHARAKGQLSNGHQRTEQDIEREAIQSE